MVDHVLLADPGNLKMTRNTAVLNIVFEKRQKSANINQESARRPVTVGSSILNSG